MPTDQLNVCNWSCLQLFTFLTVGCWCHTPTPGACSIKYVDEPVCDPLALSCGSPRHHCSHERTSQSRCVTPASVSAQQPLEAYKHKI
jgi:hypothetical protein